MVVERFANALRFEVDADGEAVGSFDVREATVEDALSETFEVRVLALSSNPELDLDAVIGRNASFTVREGLGLEGCESIPCWTGVVRSVRHLRSENTGASTYEFVVAPRVWLLTRRTNCRVFQQLTDLDIVRSILAEWEIEPSIEVSRESKTRKYRVQYQETDDAFMRRLLEAAGITFFHRRTPTGSQLVLTDAPQDGPRRSWPLAHSNEPLGGDRLFATEFAATREVRSGKLVLADHDHRLPNKPLLARADARPSGVEANLEDFRYVPGAFRFGTSGAKDTPHADDRGRTRTDGDEGSRLANQAAAAAIARSRTFRFSSNALDLAAGMVLRLVDHSLADRVGDMLLTSVKMTLRPEANPKVECRAVAARNPYAPASVTPNPAIHGVEMATVVGPAGETIHCDEFGRVRVQFHWDRYGAMDELSSCWVPVTQAWAGDGLGSLNLPRVGQEVVVSFLGGNPEEPVIVGRIFTNLLRPPFQLPENKTQNGFKSASVPATGGYNEIMFEDMAGSEQIRMRAEKDMNTRVNHDQALSVGRNRSAAISANDTEKVAGNQSKSVGGNKSQSVAGQLASSVGKDMLSQVIGNLLSMAGGDRIQQTLGNAIQNALTHQITSMQGTTITCGQSMIHIGPDAIVIQSPVVLLNPGEETASSVAMGGGVPALAE